MIFASVCYDRPSMAPHGDEPPFLWPYPQGTNAESFDPSMAGASYGVSPLSFYPRFSMPLWHVDPSPAFHRRSTFTHA